MWYVHGLKMVLPRVDQFKGLTPLEIDHCYAYACNDGEEGNRSRDQAAEGGTNERGGNQGEHQGRTCEFGGDNSDDENVKNDTNSPQRTLTAVDTSLSPRGGIVVSESETDTSSESDEIICEAVPVDDSTLADDSLIINKWKGGGIERELSDQSVSDKVNQTDKIISTSDSEKHAQDQNQCGDKIVSASTCFRQFDEMAKSDFGVGSIIDHQYTTLGSGSSPIQFRNSELIQAAREKKFKDSAEYNYICYHQQPPIMARDCVLSKRSLALCYMPGCSNRLRPHEPPGLRRVQMFRFPQPRREAARFAAWMRVTGVTGPYKRLRICEDHFITGRPSNDKTHVDYVPHAKMPSPDRRRRIIARIQRQEKRLSRFKLDTVNNAAAIGANTTTKSEPKPKPVRPPSPSNDIMRFRTSMQEILEEKNTFEVVTTAVMSSQEATCSSIVFEPVIKGSGRVQGENKSPSIKVYQFIDGQRPVPKKHCYHNCVDGIPKDAANCKVTTRQSPKCCMPGCSSRRYFHLPVGEKPIRVFRFPTALERREQWIRATRMIEQNTVKSVVCEKHFHTGRPSLYPNHVDYVPHPNLVFNNEQHQRQKGGRRKPPEIISIDTAMSFENASLSDKRSLSFKVSGPKGDFVVSGAAYTDAGKTESLGSLLLDNRQFDIFSYDRKVCKIWLRDSENRDCTSVLHFKDHKAFERFLAIIPEPARARVVEPEPVVEDVSDAHQIVFH